LPSCCVSALQSAANELDAGVSVLPAPRPARARWQPWATEPQLLVGDLSNVREAARTFALSCDAIPATKTPGTSAPARRIERSTRIHAISHDARISGTSALRHPPMNPMEGDHRRTELESRTAQCACRRGNLNFALRCRRLVGTTGSSSSEHSSRQEGDDSSHAIEFVTIGAKAAAKHPKHGDAWCVPDTTTTGTTTTTEEGREG
jgi:hypothetical protein